MNGIPQLYAGPLANGDVAAVIVNWSGKEWNQRFEFNSSLLFGEEINVVVRDLWIRQDIGQVDKGQKIGVDSIPAYGNYAYRIRKL